MVRSGAKEEEYYGRLFYIIVINEVLVYKFQLVNYGSESAHVDSDDESKEECKNNRHPSLP